MVDDIALDITHVIRGEDHVTNSAAQIQIFRALDLPLLVDAQGGGLSKRAGSLSIADLRARGIEALAIAALLARLGTADPREPVTSLDALVATVDFTASAAPRRASRKTSWRISASARSTRCPPPPSASASPREVGELLWPAVRGNLASLGDAQTWADIVGGCLPSVLEDPAFLEEAAAPLPPEPRGETTWKQWTAAVSAATQCKGRALFHPLRLALTARETGPELANLLPPIGRAKASARLRGQRA